MQVVLHTMKIFWSVGSSNHSWPWYLDVGLCCQIEMYWHFRWWYPDTRGSRFLQYVSTLLPDYNGSHPRRQQS